MSYILAIETATKVCSVALFNNDELVSSREEKGSYSHAENLAAFADELVKEANIRFVDLEAVAVSKGPGSYTGLRIGVSFAKGLCYTLKIPLISIETTEAMAHGYFKSVESKDFLVCSMIDARRMEVYAAIYNSSAERVKNLSADVVKENTYQDYLDKSKVVFIGDGADKCRSVIQHPNAEFDGEVLPSAMPVGELVYEKFTQKQFEDIAYFEPYYLKEFIALKGKKMVP